MFHRTRIPASLRALFALTIVDGTLGFAARTAFVYALLIRSPVAVACGVNISAVPAPSGSPPRRENCGGLALRPPVVGLSKTIRSGPCRRMSSGSTPCDFSWFEVKPPGLFRPLRPPPPALPPTLDSPCQIILIASSCVEPITFALSIQCLYLENPSCQQSNKKRPTRR